MCGGGGGGAKRGCVRGGVGESQATNLKLLPT